MPNCLRTVFLNSALLLGLAHANERGLDPLNFDPRVSPCRDFFEYANGGWKRANPIPPDFSQWGIDDEIDARNLGILKNILENAAAHPLDDASRKLGNFYAAALDEAAIERDGLAALRADLDAIERLQSREDLLALLADWQTQGFDVVFELQAQEDLKDSRNTIAYAGQGGLGLPDSGYYKRQDAGSALLRVSYRKHVARMLTLLGERDPAHAAEHVLALETRLAAASLDPVALRDPQNSYHMVSLDEAETTTPHFSWRRFFAGAGRGDVARFSLAQPEFFAAFDRAIVDVPVAQWRAYLRWRLIDDAAPYLGKTFVDADFDFHGHTLRGIERNKPRWKRAVASVDSAMGEALGKAYVAQVMPPEAKQRALQLVESLRAALRQRLERLDWMSAATKQAALAKLGSLGAKIGYPDSWRDYSPLPVSRNSYYGNVRAAAAFEIRRQFGKIDRPVDRDEWDMTPQTVNAYYNPMRNEIVFPAAQLLPPYFDANADDALNYGGIGAVIGHEMLHAFDDQGSKFDAQGNLVEWWTADDRARFNERTQLLVRQFGAYVPVDDLHVDGSLTLGENIADLGGLIVAYDAYKVTSQHGSQAPTQGLTPDQRFFLAYAQSWRNAERTRELRVQVRTNEHAPAKYRVNGPVSNLPAFAQAFACKQGDAMVRDERTHAAIW